MSDSTRSLAASIAANDRWANEPDRPAATLAARTAFLSRFEVQVDPEGQLSPEERQKRAQNAMKAHFRRMALASARSRKGAAERRICRQGEGIVFPAEVAAGFADAGEQGGVGHRGVPVGLKSGCSSLRCLATGPRGRRTVCKSG